MDEDIRRLTITNCRCEPVDERRPVENGMVTLRQDGFIKINAGLSSVCRNYSGDAGKLTG